MKEVVLANPRGFCAGVDRAIAIVEQALAQFGAPIYVRHEIVHNKYVVDDLRAKGAVFVEELDEVPAGSTVVFSAHGVSPAVHDDAQARGLKTIDATCPLVTKVHHEAKRFAREDYDILLVGHHGHEEVEGTAGEAPAHIQLVETAADVDGAHAADADRVVALVVAEDRDLDARVAGRLPDSGSLGRLDLDPVDGEADGAVLGRCFDCGGHVRSVFRQWTNMSSRRSSVSSGRTRPSASRPRSA